MKLCKWSLHWGMFRTTLYLMSVFQAELICFDVIVSTPSHDDASASQHKLISGKSWFHLIASWNNAANTITRAMHVVILRALSILWRVSWFFHDFRQRNFEIWCKWKQNLDCVHTENIFLISNLEEADEWVLWDSFWLYWLTLATLEIFANVNANRVCEPASHNIVYSEFSWTTNTQEYKRLVWRQNREEFLWRRS